MRVGSLVISFTSTLRFYSFMFLIWFMNLRLALLKAGLKSCLRPFANIKNNNVVKNYNPNHHFLYPK